ncbi:MAG: type II toxin-antitoxin system VapC family toxin [Micrococcales bacterium]|nr:type II toxin-antitoxin system VapC family toxin [Micrococcales bacterium]
MTGRTAVLDSEALAAVARRDPRVAPVLAFIVEKNQRMVVPAVVLAELMTGRPTDAGVWHAVNRLVVADITARIAADAGARRERATAVRPKKRDLTVDALVVATAAQFAPAVVITADPDDIRLLVGDDDITVTTLDGRDPR